MSGAVSFLPLTPWTVHMRSLVAGVVGNMAPLDRVEIMATRSTADVYDLVSDLGVAIAGGLLIEGFLAVRFDRGEFEAVGVAAALRAPMPRTANIVFFGRVGHARVMPAVYRELERRAATLHERHGIVLAQVPILREHRAARRMAQSIGGREAFEYGPVGRDGEGYVHTIWRLDHGRIVGRAGAPARHGTETGDHEVRP